MAVKRLVESGKWKVVTLGDVAEIKMCKRIFAEQTSTNGDIPFYKIGTFGKKPDAYISEALYQEYKNKYSFPSKGDILLSAAGTLGRTVVYDGKPSYYQDSNIVWLDVDKNRISNEYLFHYYQIIKWASPEGSTISRLYNGIIRKTEIYLPTLAEQKAIAAALSDADALIAALEGLIAKKRQIKQGSMQELLSGESGKWRVKSFGELVSIRNQKVDPRKVDEPLFCVELEHIDQGTGRLIGSTETNNTSSIKTVFKKGDVLFGKLRAYLRKYWLADRDGVCTTEIWALIANPQEVIKEYLFQLVQTDKFIEIASMAYGTHMPRTDWNIVKNFEVKLPPSLEEQSAIAAILSEMDAEIAALESKLSKTRQIKVGMMQALLTGRVRLTP